MDHGDNRKDKIVERGRWKEGEDRKKRAVRREDLKFRNGSGIDGS